MMFEKIKKSYLPQARSRMLILFVILMFCAVTTGAVVDATAKKVTVNEVNEFTGKNDTQTIRTRVDSVGQFIEMNNIVLGEYDTISAEAVHAVKDGMTITIRRGIPVTVETAEGTAIRTVTYKTAAAAAMELGYAEGGFETVPEGDAEFGSNLRIMKITYEDLTFEEQIPFEEEIIYDDTMVKGQTRIVTPGVYGIKSTVFRVKYRDGVEEYGVKTSETVTQQPSKQVVAHGTQDRAVDVKATKGFATAGSLSSRGVMRYKQKLTMNATAYDTSPGQNGGYARTAIGLVPDMGVVAVDPKVIPLGSRLYIESTDDGQSWVYGYAIAGDTGGAIKGNKIDLCYKTNSECRAFGRRQATVYVLE